MARIDPFPAKTRPPYGAAWLFVVVIMSLVATVGRCEAFLWLHGPTTFESRSCTTVSSPELAEQQQGRTSYFLIPPTNNTSTSRDWQQLCPPVWNPQQNRDSSLLWSCCDDTEHVATELLRQLDPTVHNPRIVATLAQSLQQFRDFCSDKLRAPHQGHHHGMTFKARVVATRGSSGTKCPQWHVDHVPVRWIQSLVGPGCEMVVGNIEQGIAWELINGLNENHHSNNDDDNDHHDVVALSVHDRNQVLVKDRISEVYQGKEMEAVLLIGNRWADYAKDSTFLPPVVHKSPTIPWGCERVLLTQDILYDDGDD